MTLDSAISEFVERSRRLIQLERQAEVDESAALQATHSAADLERRGVCFARLRVAGEHAGLGGRTLLDLERTRGGPLPPSRIGPGDLVSVRPLRAGRRPSRRRARTGVVWRLDRQRVTLALDGSGLDPPEEPLRVDRVANDVTYRRLEEVLDQLPRYRGGPADRLRKIFFGAVEPASAAPEEVDGLDPRLDVSQKDAVLFALAARDVALIHGPPGTGKTTTLVEIIRHAVLAGERVLACANSNVAVDNLAERLALRNLEIVRTGHPARLLESVIGNSLESHVERAEGTRVASNMRRELDRLHKKLGRTANFRARRELRSELRTLQAQLRTMEMATVRNVLEGADVVLSTNIGAADGVLAGLDFDLVVIDEAAQALEAAAWIPILKGRRAILAGDHRQLPPTIRSREAERDGLAATLFERLTEAIGATSVRMLKTQYRMHERIMEWSSGEFYDDRLEAHASVRNHLLADLPDCEKTADTAAPLLLIDTAGCDLEEEIEEDSQSKANEGEAALVVSHLERLVEAGVRPEEIGVVTPYNAQVGRLRRRLGAAYPSLEIDSVDGFQGREKEAVIISLVRSNPRGDVGFLADERRMNVAVTRARRHLAVVGDSATVSSLPFLSRLMSHFQERGEYRSAWGYV